MLLECLGAVLGVGVCEAEDGLTRSSAYEDHVNRIGTDLGLVPVEFAFSQDFVD